MKTMKNYHNMYLKRDVLLLADVFENFRNNSLNNYGLHPSHYLSTKVLSWDSMLNMTKVELRILTCTFSLKKGTRARISFISNGYSKANNEYFKSYKTRIKKQPRIKTNYILGRK